MPQGAKLRRTRKANRASRGEQLELGLGLIERMSAEELRPEDYEDEYRKRVLSMIEQKAAGGEIKPAAAPARQPAQMIDLMEALKKSVETERARAQRKAAREKYAKVR
jgi:DNA end-binding protein Ku